MKLFNCVILALFLLISTGCGNGPNPVPGPLPEFPQPLHEERCQREAKVKPYFGYKPPFLPISFIFDESGIHVTGDASFVTPLGVFTLGAALPIANWAAEDIVLILRDKNRGDDHVYLIQGGQGMRIVVDGRTVIDVYSCEIVIDITESTHVELSAPTGNENIPNQSNNITGEFRLISPADIACNRDFTTNQFRWSYTEALPAGWNFEVHHKSRSNPYGIQTLRTRDHNIEFPIYAWTHHANTSARDSYWEVRILDQEDHIVLSNMYAPCK